LTLPLPQRLRQRDSGQPAAAAARPHDRRRCRKGGGVNGAVETHWPANRPLTGLVVTRYGHGVGPLKRIEVFEASHPVPDPAGRETARVAILVDRGHKEADDWAVRH
jgi:Domain of unknown function (DUF4147)